jgi:hypothetical protein
MKDEVVPQPAGQKFWRAFFKKRFFLPAFLS